MGSWDFTSGLPEHFSIDAENTWFEEGDYGTSLHIEGRLEDFDSGEVDDEGEVRLSIGRGYEVVDEGQAVEHPTGRAFNRSSTLVKTITTNEDFLETIQAKGEAFEAPTFAGFRYTLRRVQGETFKTDDGEERQRQWYEIEDFEELGKGKKGKGKSSAKSGGKAKAKSGGKGKDNGSGKIRAKLVKLAAKYEDHDDFVEAAQEEFEDELDADDELNAAVLDEDEIFAEAH